MKYPRGSEWRKWDLHVHTPDSIVSSYGKATPEIWEKYISDLEKLPVDFKVLGINDYLFLDGYKRLIDEKKKGRLQNIDLLLPVLEFRISKFAGVDFRSLKRINLHVIFSNVVSCETIESQFLNTLHQGYKLSPGLGGVTWDGVITKDSLKDLGAAIKKTVPPNQLSKYGSDLEKGFNNLNLDEEQIFNSLDKEYFKGKYLIAIGKTEWDELRWTEGTISEKKNIINKADIVFTAADGIEKYQNAKNKLKENGVNDLLLDCSDAHSFSDSTEKDRIGNCHTWIKADPTFKGLKQIVIEPEGRVFVGEKPPKVKCVERNKTKYIDSVKIGKGSQSKTEDVWFDNEVFFNQGLVAIIGKKGSGKSALADILGLLGKTKNNAYFSFLNDKKFKKIRDNKAENFSAKMEWISKEKTDGETLNSTISREEVERVRYIPQHFLETICNELSKDKVGEIGVFESTLGKVIFSHLDKAEMEGQTTLDDLITYKTKECRNAIDSQKFNLKKINNEIVRLEGLEKDSYKESVRNKIDVKKNEIREHKKNIPAEILKPNDITKATIDEVLNEQIKGIRVKIEELEKNIEEAINLKVVLVINISKIDELEKKFETFGGIYREFKTEAELICKFIGIPYSDLVVHTVNIEPLESKKEELLEELKGVIGRLNEDNNESMTNEKAVLEKELKNLQAKLDEPNRNYQKYLEEEKVWGKTMKALEGSIEQVGSLNHFERLLKEANDAPESLKEVRKERLKVFKLIYKEVAGIRSIFERYYAPVQKFIEKNTKKGGFLVESKLVMNFEASIVEDDFSDKFFDYIDRGSISAFHGIRESSKLLSDLLQRLDLNKFEDVQELISKILKLLTDGKEKRPLEISNQLRKDKTLESFYNFLFSLDYLRPKYSLTWDNKNVSELSPGEKGTLLLIFYLLIDKEEMPLIIDQPEENLDNETIYRVLVPCIKVAKQRRQVIIVTHNPNLAVVCDAEQIICASIDKQRGFKVTYDTGSIENPEINKKILDILEGTRPAFDNRDSKYIPKL
jgi:ABC-type lipoprotein export system ATPase subunit